MAELAAQAAAVPHHQLGRLRGRRRRLRLRLRAARHVERVPGHDLEPAREAGAEGEDGPGDQAADRPDADVHQDGRRAEAGSPTPITIVDPDLKGTMTLKQWETREHPGHPVRGGERRHRRVHPDLPLPDAGALQRRPDPGRPHAGAPRAALLHRHEARRRLEDRQVADRLLAAPLAPARAGSTRLEPGSPGPPGERVACAGGRIAARSVASTNPIAGAAGNQVQSFRARREP